MFKSFDPDQEYQKLTESKSVIRFQDCDPLRHLNNAKYFDYFFNAREDQVLELYEISPGDIFNKFGAGWVVYQHQIAYVRPAMVGETVKIMSRCIYYDEDTLIVEYFMTDIKRKQLKTLLWTTLKFIEVKTGKKTPHPVPILNFLKAVTDTRFDKANTDINSRIKEIKEELINYSS
ncbi:acyl-CoA thioesterase [Chondrinema litorale]|uniref:acyl-CoA thioesterase n=1 Tax=Chondrinema litorale TaxID=2994555 RepID=UPI0032B460B2